MTMSQAKIDWSKIQAGMGQGTDDRSIESRVLVNLIALSVKELRCVSSVAA